MMFFFKPKVIHMDCFTSRADTYEYFPIEYTHKFFPQWWKDLPKVRYREPQWFGYNTIKNCTGFNNFYASGITIPMWSDFLIQTQDTQMRWQFADKRTDCTSHSFEQMEGYLDPRKYVHLKISTPWHFKCNEDIDFMWVQNTWSFNNPDEIIIPPAIIDYKFQIGTNINLFTRRSEIGQQKNILIEANQPMVNIIPLSGRKLKIKNHLVDEKEMMSMGLKNSPMIFHGLYNFRKRLIQKKEKKCPFNF